MKKIILACAIMSCVSIGANAQNAQSAPPGAPRQQTNAPLNPATPMTPEQRAERESKMLEQMYSLNPEQYKGVYQASLEMAKKMDAQRASGKQPTREDFEGMMAEKDAKYKKVMTAEQYAKYESTRHRPSSSSVPAPAPMPPAKR